MIDDIDRSIAMDAFADYELVFHSVQEIAKINKCNLIEAFITFESKFDRLSKQLPLSYYKTDSLDNYDAMEQIFTQKTRPEEIFDSQGKIAGPPYVFFSYKDIQGASESYDAFIDNHGLPQWLSEGKPKQT